MHKIYDANIHFNDQISDLINALHNIKEKLQQEEICHKDLISEVHSDHIQSARNLIHYVALRKIDMLAIQEHLAAFGLSSLGRAEGHVIATLNAVLQRLHESLQIPYERSSVKEISFADGKSLLEKNTALLFTTTPKSRTTRIMVTLPTEAAYNPSHLESLLKSGTDCIRINCAHDNVDTWLKMVNNVHQAIKTTQINCKIAMDLGGPKLRTGSIKPSPPVVKVSPARDKFGNVIQPAKLILKTGSDSKCHLIPTPSIIVDTEWLNQLSITDRIHIADARGKSRYFLVKEKTDNYCLIECEKSTYIINGTQLTIQKHRSRQTNFAINSTKITSIPFEPQFIPLSLNGKLHLMRNSVVGEPQQFDEKGQLLTEACIGCTLPEAFDAISVDDTIWFDDGKIGGIIEKIDQQKATIRITHIKSSGDKLYSDKGINLPDSKLNINAITDKDADDLHFIAEHADIINFSFVNTTNDINDLFTQLDAITDREIGVVLKIETQQAFNHLPELILSGMRKRIIGVMIARGDLAVECGFTRMAEIQEEVLWICEAAHIPVIWATQVLEGLAKKGFASRAEITDAAAGHRAECIMLNKGPHIIEAIETLNTLLEKMQFNEYKKSHKLRRLSVAEAFSH